MIPNIADKFAGRTRRGYLTAFILLLISYIISFVSTQNLVKQSRWVNHSNEILHSLDNVLRYVTESESAARGYIITNNQSFLTKFNSSQNNTDSVWQTAKSLTADNPAQAHNIDSLRGLIDARFKILERSISIFDSAHSINPLLHVQYPGVTRMNEVEKCVHFIQDNEIKILRSRSSEASKYSVIIKAFTVVSLLLAIILTLFSVITFNKENREKLEASRKADAYRQELEKRVEELGALNLELLELRNLEKFASTGRIARTIAHEVRNPLTNINLATEQLRNELPADSGFGAFFEIIHRNSNRINELISNLLNATRINELSYVKISINDVIDSSL
ncbi:MAG TPA: CHASE3 domain-containing protein, partial [Chitinophagaceae bacterium]|nr:CHASE3 domain-containing protein [Chitinophagaceae bacterium]